jgi:lysophospholipase L1-like esterase
MKKRIVCFGDSNTWGYNGSTSERFDDETRWTGVFSSELGESYTVIEEGQNGRTTVWDDPIEGEKNGLKYLIPCLESAKPIDLLIIMLGTNDLKRRFSVSARDIAQSAARLAQIAKQTTFGRNGAAPKVLLVAPILLGDIEKSRFGEMFDPSAVGVSRNLAHWYKLYADELGCDYFNAAQYADPDESDQLHIAPCGHAALGKAIARKTRDIIG